MISDKKLIRLLLVLWFVFLAVIVGLVIYFSLHLEQMAKDNQQQDNRITLNAEQIAQLNVLVKNLSEQAKVPGPEGPQGDRGADGQNSTSTHTEVVKETPVKGDKGDALKYEDLTDEQKAELKGESALQIELCKQRGTLELGWRYAGTSLCLPIEVAE